LNVTFLSLEKYALIPDSEMAKINIGVIVILLLIYLLIFWYPIIMFIISLPELKKRFSRPPPERYLPPREYTPFDPNLAPKIPMQNAGPFQYDK